MTTGGGEGMEQPELSLYIEILIVLKKNLVKLLLLQHNYPGSSNYVSQCSFHKLPRGNLASNKEFRSKKAETPREALPN